jgi:hypothetical protein
VKCWRSIFLIKINSTSKLPTFVWIKTYLICIAFLSLSACEGLKPDKAEDEKSSINQDIESTVCWSDLKTIYASTYHPLLSGRCVDCHSSAHGSKDLGTSFAAFMSKGVSLIDSRATHNHGGNSVNVAQMQIDINNIKPQWTSAEDNYNQCLIEYGFTPGGAISGSLLELNSQNITSNLQSAFTQGIWYIVQWDLDTDVPDVAKGKYHALFTVKAHYYFLGGSIFGIELKDPTITLKELGTSFHVKNIKVKIGDQVMSNTTYMNVDETVMSIVPTNLAPGFSSALVVFDDDADSTNQPSTILGIQFTT